MPVVDLRHRSPERPRAGVPVMLGRRGDGTLGASIATEDLQLNYLGYQDGSPPRIVVEVKRDNRAFRECDLRLRVHAPGTREPLADVVLDTTKWHLPAFGSCYAKQSVVLSSLPASIVFVVSDAGGKSLGTSRPIDPRSGAEVDDAGYESPDLALPDLGELKTPLLVAGAGLAALAVVVLLSR